MSDEGFHARGRTAATSQRTSRRYALVIDFDVGLLEDELGESFGDALAESQAILQTLGFVRSQGHVYIGGDTVDAVKCVLASMELSSRLPWFSDCVRDVQMLRIEETNSLMQAVRRANGLAAGVK